MANKEVRERVEGIWRRLKGLRAQEIEAHIELSRQLAETIVGVSEIERVRNSSLLKLLSYELIVFADEKTSNRKEEVYT